MRRQMPSSKESVECLKSIAQTIFKDDDMICLIFDDSKIKKMYSKQIEGTGRHYFEKYGRMFIAFKIIVAAITNGKNMIPIEFDYINASENTDADPTLQKFSKVDYIKGVYEQVKSLFPNKKIVIIADGLFGTIEVLKFVTENKIKAIFRCAKNRKVFYQDQKISIENIADLKCSKMQQSRTVSAIWHTMDLYFTCAIRIDKHQDISNIYLVSTFADQQQSSLISELYQKRWLIEKLFRTTKQSLGLGECFSKILEKQRDHIASVFVSYAILQMQQKKTCAASPEEAKRQIVSKKTITLKSRIALLDRIFSEAHA